MATLPTPLRAALGLAVTALEEARKLPETLPQAPVVAVSTAMQVSLRVQQRIAELAARGDEVLSQLRGTSSEPPEWATFDDTPDPAPPNGSGRGLAAFDRVPDETGFEAAEIGDSQPAAAATPIAEPASKPAKPASKPAKAKPTLVSAAETIAPVKASPTRAAKAKAAKAKAAPKVPGTKATTKKTAAAKVAKTPAKAARAAKATKRTLVGSEPLTDAANRAQPSETPNPSTMAAEIVQAHQADQAPSANPGIE